MNEKQRKLAAAYTHNYTKHNGTVVEIATSFNGWPSDRPIIVAMKV
jgi:hypothetical protein